MSQTFAQVVEDVRQLSPAEQEELHQILEKCLIEERRRQILENCQSGLQELRDGKLTAFADTESLMNSLSND